MYVTVRLTLTVVALWGLALAGSVKAQSLTGLALPQDTPFVPHSVNDAASPPGSDYAYILPPTSSMPTAIQSPPGIYPILLAPPPVTREVRELVPPEERMPAYFASDAVPTSGPTTGDWKSPNLFAQPAGVLPPGGVNTLPPPGSMAPAMQPAQDPYCVAPGAMSGMGIRQAPFTTASFLQTPLTPAPYNSAEELATYRSKYAVPVQRPWVEFWRPFYTPGIYPPAPDVFGKTNLLFPHFYVYGDYRTAVGVNKNQAGNARSWAHRLNLDMDLGLTATERIHGFMGPLDHNNQFTRLDFTDNTEFEFVTDAKFDTLYFEGDAGAITGGMSGIDSPFDLPFTFGLVPLLYQNGIWMEDAVLGAAVALPARHSTALHWSNFDATFFAVGDQLTSDAFQGSNSAAEALGTAWFIDAYDGYFEVDYAYVHDDLGKQRSYNNFAVGFTRRYLMRLSNSVRFITNFGQDLPAEQRTADGYLLLVENSLISSSPNTFVPYCNMFYGSGRPQSVARAAGSGGILRNTGINFETDGLTGYPTLDPTAANTYGAALGLNLLGANFSDQLVVEAAALGSYGSSTFKRVAGDQYAVGVRYQRPLSHRWLIRADSMVGFLRNADDIIGNRIELRWKF